MIKKILKLLVFFLFILTGCFLWGRGKRPSLYLKWEELDSQIPRFSSRPGVLIIFNSGGWGNTAFEEAEDFAKVIRGVKTTVEKLGWGTIVVSYGRTKDNFWGRIRGMREILNSFKSQSKKLAKQINIFLENNPGCKVLVAGLSLGADFAGETMEKIGKNPSVFAIKAGTPFWDQGSKSGNVLELVNERDVLAIGDYRNLAGHALKGMLRWAIARLERRHLFLDDAIRLSGHRYDWKSLWVRKKITAFLENNLKQ